VTPSANSPTININIIAIAIPGQSISFNYWSFSSLAEEAVVEEEEESPSLLLSEEYADAATAAADEEIIISIA
jgi:hypothetical protein